jgi:hypothetical protein
MSCPLVSLRNLAKRRAQMAQTDRPERGSPIHPSTPSRRVAPSLISITIGLGRVAPSLISITIGLGRVAPSLISINVGLTGGGCGRTFEA